MRYSGAMNKNTTDTTLCNGFKCSPHKVYIKKCVSSKRSGFVQYCIKCTKRYIDSKQLIHKIENVLIHRNLPISEEQQVCVKCRKVKTAIHFSIDFSEKSGKCITCIECINRTCYTSNFKKSI
jgi:hypothetical protein